MKTLTKALLCTALITAASSSAYAKEPMDCCQKMAQMQHSSKDMQPTVSDPQSTKDFKEVGMKMMKNMDVAYTGNPDVDFRTHMIPHHQGAIDMAEVALKHAKDPETKKMAQMIIDAQKKEIAEMQDWLKTHGK